MTDVPAGEMVDNSSEPLPPRDPRTSRPGPFKHLSSAKTSIHQKPPQFPKIIKSLETLSLKGFENSFPGICQEIASIPKIQEIKATGKSNWESRESNLTAWLFDQRNVLIRWSAVKDGYKFPHPDISFENLISFEPPIPLLGLSSLEVEKLPLEREAVKRVHNWVIALDTRPEHPNVLTFWLKSIIAGTRPDNKITTKDKPNGYLIDWPSVENKYNCLAWKLRAIMRAKIALVKAFDQYNLQQVDYYDRPQVNVPKFYSSALHSLAKTVKGNTEALFVKWYLSERLCQCNQDFNQTLIEFEQAYLETINCKMYEFVDCVNSQPN